MRLYPLIFVAFCLSAPAFSQSTDDERRSESISLAQVRFDDPGSVADLRRKVARAVRRVCAPDGMRVDYSVHARMCRTEAQAMADRQLAQIMRQTKYAAIAPR